MEERTVSILIVDDQPANLKTLRSFLKNEGFEVRIALTGEQALSTLAEYQADVILLDVMRPGLNGFETCERIKENQNTADIPVIFMTTLDSIEDKLAGFKAGGTDYITKPFQQYEIIARMNTHVSLRRKTLELTKALAEVKILSGFLPICSFCKSIRDDDGAWHKWKSISLNILTPCLAMDCVKNVPKNIMERS